MTPENEKDTSVDGSEGSGGVDVQKVVEEVDDHLQNALQHAQTYHKHDDVRPSALMAFDEVNEAREALDAIDERDFNEGDDGDE